MPELSTNLDILLAVANAVGCQPYHGPATDSSTTAITVADYPVQSNRTNASSKTYEGDEVYLRDAQASSTLNSAITAASATIAVGSGSTFAASSARPYLIGIESEFILVTLSTNTFTVLARGQLETRAAAHAAGATVYGPARTPNPNGIGLYVASTGVLTPSVTYGADPGTTLPVSIFNHGVSIQDIRLAVNRAIRDYFYEDYIPLTMIPDGDMRENGITHWTAYGTLSASSGKNFGGESVEGPNRLRTLATAVNSGYLSDTLFVDPTNAPTWYIRALVRVSVGTGTLRAYGPTGRKGTGPEAGKDPGTTSPQRGGNPHTPSPDGEV